MSQKLSEIPASAAAPHPPASAPSMLTYEPSEEVAPRGSRPWWVYAVVIAYLLILAGALVTVIIIMSPGDRNELGPPLAVAVGLLLTAEVGLIAIPIRTRGRRPIRRRALWVPILASGFMAAVLFLGAAMALLEWGQFFSDPSLELIGIAAVVLWATWALIFWFVSPSENATGFANRLHRYLMAGSVLELLVAVPTHVVVRRRHDCCGGMATGIGICIGVVVMFLAFGPSIVLLFYRRWQNVSNSRGRTDTLK